MEAKKFRLKGKSLFLTYPQCPLDKAAALEQLLQLLPVEKALVAEEQHEDGSPHLHAYVKLTKEVNYTN